MTLSEERVEQYAAAFINANKNQHLHSDEQLLQQRCVDHLIQELADEAPAANLYRWFEIISASVVSEICEVAA